MINETYKDNKRAWILLLPLLYAIITKYVGIGAIYVITSPFCGSGSRSLAGASNGSSRYLEFGKAIGDSVLELLSTPTKISGAQYV
jgi:hypothetical protein